MIGAPPSIISFSILKTQSFLQGKSAYDPFFVDLFRSLPKETTEYHVISL